MSLLSSHIRLDQRPAFARRLASTLDLSEGKSWFFSSQICLLFDEFLQTSIL